MEVLPELFSSRTKAEIFRLLFGPVKQELHLRELARQSGLNASTLRQELTRLCKLGLVESRRNSNRVYYQANPLHPLHADLHSMVLKTSGFAELFQIALQPLKVELAFAFSSYPPEDSRAHDRIELLVIGPASLREVSHHLATDTIRKLGRELIPVAMTRPEFLRTVRQRDPLIIAAIKSWKLFVIGDEEKLERMLG